MTTRTAARLALGLPADPWGPLHLPTADTERVRELIDAAIDGRAIVQIVGETGIGKTQAILTALRARPTLDLDRDLIRVSRLDREQRTIADVVRAIFRTLGQPIPTGGAEARDIELRRVLGQATRIVGGRPTRPLVVMLDDAHLLHWRTIDALKGLREHDWQGVAPLVGVILVGQRDALATRREIRQRSDTLHCAGLSTAEASTALRRAMGGSATEEAIDILASAGGGAPRTWNDLIERSDAAILHAIQAGHTRVERMDAHLAIGADLRELARASGVTQADIARQTGISETQVSRILSGERKDRAAQDRIRALLAGSIAGPSPQAKQAVGGQ
jgi:type II secretory pathway predicted ATPase ExeA